MTEKPPWSTMPTESPKVQLARDISRELIAEDGALAVLLVGSVALGTDSEDSDVDLIVVLDQPEAVEAEHREVRGTRVGIERYPAAGFLALPEVPVQDLDGLRDSGRFARGRALVSKWPQLEAVQAAWRNAILDPREATDLLSLAKTYLDPTTLEELSSDAEWFWTLQGAASALAMMGLSLSPCRFQKPKWVMQDLAASGRSQLAAALKQLHVAAGTTVEATVGILEGVRRQLDEACNLGGYPPLSFAPENGQELVYIYQTYRDGVSLSGDGDLAGCLFTAGYSLRIMNAYLQRDSPEPELVDDGRLARWRERSLAVLWPSGVPSRSSLGGVIATLSAVGPELEEEYRRASAGTTSSDSTSSDSTSGDSTSGGGASSHLPPSVR